jgi:hypothetical protein
MSLVSTITARRVQMLLTPGPRSPIGESRPRKARGTSSRPTIQRRRRESRRPVVTASNSQGQGCDHQQDPRDLTDLLRSPAPAAECIRPGSAKHVHLSVSVEVVEGQRSCGACCRLQASRIAARGPFRHSASRSKRRMCSSAASIRVRERSARLHLCRGVCRHNLAGGSPRNASTAEPNSGMIICPPDA